MTHHVGIHLRWSCDYVCFFVVTKNYAIKLHKKCTTIWSYENLLIIEQLSYWQKWLFLYRYSLYIIPFAYILHAMQKKYNIKIGLSNIWFTQSKVSEILCSFGNLSSDLNKMKLNQDLFLNLFETFIIELHCVSSYIMIQNMLWYSRVVFTVTIREK